MTLEQFKEKSKRTCPSLGTKGDLAHMVMGMVTEITELDDAVTLRDTVNIGEEVADFYWYLMNYITFRKLDIDLKFNKENKYRVDSKTLIYGLYNTTAKLVDHTKKFMAYNRTINLADEIRLIRDLDLYLQAILLRRSIDLGVVLQNNVDKLLKRFPEGYSDEKANNRDLAAELKELEKK